MVFTHIPSSLFLGSAAIAPSFPVAAALFLLRESLAEMDVPTRQSYVMAVVRPEERTVTSGITNLVRLAGWAVAPAIGGVLMEAIPSPSRSSPAPRQRSFMTLLCGCRSIGSRHLKSAGSGTCFNLSGHRKRPHAAPRIVRSLNAVIESAFVHSPTRPDLNRPSW